MQHVIVGVDGSEHAAKALRWAVALGARRSWAVTATLAWHTLDQYWPERSTELQASYDADDAQAALAAYVAEALADEPGDVSRQVLCGDAADQLLDAAADAALLVVGSRGRGRFRSAVLGSVSQYCAQAARCPVAIVHGGPASGAWPAPRRVVVGVDGSEPSRRALHWAVDDARTSGAEVDVVHAWHDPYREIAPSPVAPIRGEVEQDVAKTFLDATIRSIDPSSLPGRVEPILISGPPTRSLLDTAQGADMIVLGARGSGGFAGLLLGSVSQQTSVHARCPVVIVP